MKSKTNLFLIIGLLLMPLGFASCEDDFDEHYDTPSWLKGSAYEVLEKEGNYTSFLKGVDLTNFKPIVNGKSILTVMAPDDAAFSTYLKGEGYNTIEEMYNANPEAVKKLIGFHLMYYAFDWNNLVNFRPDEGDGATEEEMNVAAGYYYKHRTKSSDDMTIEYDAVLGDSVQVYHFERFLPVFSSKLFETKGIDAKYNYEYFYPNTTWTGGSYSADLNGGFNVSNASVSDANSVVTDNGYLYHISQVLKPLETIYTELKTRDKYSRFFELYDSYSTYDLNTELTQDFGNGEDVYLHSHGSLPPIAYEWPTSNYLFMSQLSRESYNVFAPSNAALDKFFADYWTQGGYTSLSDLDALILYYFIAQSFSQENFIVFPEEIKNGKVLTSYSTVINIDPDEVDDRIMCANGTLYGMDEMKAPAIFSSVIGPAFKDKRYLPFLYALSGSDLILSLSSSNSEFVVLLPDTAQFTTSEMRLQTFPTGTVLQKWDDEAGAFVEMGAGQMQDIVNMHVCSGVSELKKEGVQVLETNVAFNYWFVKDGKITTNVLFNQYLDPAFTGDPFVDLPEETNNDVAWDNGRAYSYKQEGIFEADGGDGLAYALAICNDKNYPYYLFSQLLQKAGLVDGSKLTCIMQDSRFFTFIPTNEAIKNHIAEIPGASGLKVSDAYELSGTVSTTNKARLANYLRAHFVTSDLNTFTTYPYIGSGLQGDFDTYGTEKIRLIDNGSVLSVGFVEGEKSAIDVVDTYFYLPFAYKDGCFHLLNDVIL